MCFCRDTAANRYVKGNTVFSDSEPEIAIQVDDAFAYAGRQSFILFSNSNVTQFYFVKDKGKKVNALITIQFEGYLPEINQVYNYKIKDSVMLDGAGYLYSTVYNQPPKVLNDTIQSDVWHRFSFLNARGYGLPDEVIGYRFVKLIDETKRKEMLIIYNEDVKNTGRTSEELEKDQEKLDRVLSKLLQRALKSFTIKKYR